MKIRQIVPALAVLLLAGEAAALDSVAPVTSLATDDTLLTPVFAEGSVPDADAVANADPASALDLAGLAGRCYAYGAIAGWASFSTGISPEVSPTTSGIAIIATSINGCQGEWWYNVGGGWVQLPATSDDSALVLALSNGVTSNQVRFVPYAWSGSGTATLTFRIWDGSDWDSLGTNVPGHLFSTLNTDLFAPQTYGGSPTSYSAETRTLTVHVNGVNDPPELISGPDTPSIIARVPKTVGDLLNPTPFTDPDGTDVRGIAITEFDTVDAGWFYSTNGGANWASLLDARPVGLARVLGPDALLRFDGANEDATNRLTVHGWDQTSGNSGETITWDSSVSGSADFIGVDVVANHTPGLDSISGLDQAGVLHVRRGTTATISASGYDVDTGDITTWTAESIAGGSGPGSLVVMTRNDSQSDITYDAGSDNLDTIEVSITDLALNAAFQVIEVVVTDNIAPVIDDGTSGPAAHEFTVHAGDSIDIPLTSIDGNGDDLDWTADFRYPAEPTLGSITLDASNTAATDGNTITFDADQHTVGDQNLTITANDHYSGGLTSLNVIIHVVNAPPSVAVTSSSSPSVHLGDTLTITLSSDDTDGDALAWSSNSAGVEFGALSTGAGDGNTATYTPSGTGTDNVTFTVDDGNGGVTTTATLAITVLPALNQPPTIDLVTAGSFAIVDQSFEAVVRASDPNSDDIPRLTLGASESSSLPVTISKLAGGLWRLRWTPTQQGSEHSVSLTVTDPDSLTGSRTFYLDYVLAPETESLVASVPTSTAGNIVYGGIAPGSTSAFGVLNTFLNGQPRSVARAFWWNGSAYAELPASAAADPLRNGVFLASTAASNLTFNPPTQPAPFAVPLPAGKWTFFGIPPLLLAGGENTSATSHPWSAIQLQQEDGTAVSGLSAIGAVIGPAAGTNSSAETQPFEYRWDQSPVSYQRAATLSSGTGYWIRNRSAQNHRLVRLATSQLPAPAPAAPNAIALAAAAPVAPRAADLPPAPPAGDSAGTTAAAEGGGGSCGVGGLSGLLLAGLALIGLRPRRRA